MLTHMAELRMETEPIENLCMGAEDNAKVNLVFLNMLVAKGKALVKITSFLWQLQCYKCGFSSRLVCLLLNSFFS